ncbi:hypothetical protein EV196_10427 [Mariniflexile fucanivorans]|uniref:Uncharacterized protein n=1 Tax=Mariniflexile fucanivorans TaxID=264023 RepID=A0A4R1RJM7_9FLAO|nr:hypothetical protein EV196_10427 [Mariniflexile fucanivorans]
MKPENTENFLRKFDYNYQRNNDKIIINMEFSQQLLIDFSNPEKPIIINKLVGWNCLTGIINTSIKNAFLINSIVILALSFIIYFNNHKIALYAFMGLVIWSLLWTSFYITKYEKLKSFLLNVSN